MKIKYIAVALLVLLANALKAQTLRGVVEETGTHVKLSDVFVHDVANKQATLTEKNGSFAIATEVGHVLIFSSPGYVSDTLYVTDFKEKHIQLQTQSFALRQVNITASSAFDPHAEYPEVYERSKVYVLSPTSWFGKDARDARRLKRYFVREAQERHIDSVFSVAYVSSIIPLRGRQLEDFMTMYRPTYDFVVSNKAESMAVYINDCYKKYMALPADKRHVPALGSAQ